MKLFTEAEMAGQISSWFASSESWRTPYKLYRLYLDLDETYFWESKVFIPECFTIIWTALPKMIKAILDQEPYIKMRPLMRGAIEGAKIGETLLNEQLKQVNDQGLYLFLVKSIQDMLIYGNSFFDVGWKFLEAMRRRRVPVYETFIKEIQTPLGVLPIPVQDFVGYEMQEELEVIYDDPEITPLDWFDVYPDPLATSMYSGNSRFSIYRQVKSEEEVEALKNVDGYKNLTKINFSYDETSVSNFDEKKQIDEVINTFGTGGGGQDKTEFLYCQWKRFNKGRYEEWLTVISDKTNVVFNQRSPYFHDQRTIIKTDCFPLNNRLYSIGMLEPAEDLQGAINQRFNQMADSITTALSPMTKVTGNELYLKLYDMFGSTLPTTPGLMIPRANLNEDIAPIHQVTNVRPAQEEVAYIKDILEEATVPQVSKGSLPDRKETATGIAITQGQANERFITIMNIFFYTGLRPMSMQMMELNHQFKTMPMELQLENEQGIKEFREVSMMEMPRTGIAFEPNMAFIDPLLSGDAKALALTETVAQLANTPGGAWIKWPKITRAIFELRRLGFDTEEFLLTDEEKAQQEQQELQLQLMMAQIQARGQGQGQRQLPPGGAG
jgi:hypothetical protein